MCNFEVVDINISNIEINAFKINSNYYDTMCGVGVCVCIYVCNTLTYTYHLPVF